MHAISSSIALISRRTSSGVQKELLAPLKLEERRAFVAALQKIANAHNESSRAPLRPSDAAQPALLSTIPRSLRRGPKHPRPQRSRRDLKGETMSVAATALIDVQAIINNCALSHVQLLLLVLCFFVVAVDGFDTAAIGLIATAIRVEWGSTPAQLAPLFGAGLFGLRGCPRRVGSVFHACVGWRGIEREQAIRH